MQQPGSSLPGREDDVRAVARALGSTGTARTVLVTGAGGVGKTTVVESGRLAAVQGGAKVLRLGLSTSEGEPGTAALVDAVCRLLARISDGRLPARVVEIRRVELRTAGRDGGLALLSTIGEVLTDAAEHVPFSMVVDGIDGLPPATASALGLLLRVFRPVGLPVVLASRPAAPAHRGEHLPPAADDVLDLGPLAPDDVREMLSRRLGHPVEPDLVTAVARSLGPLRGNPAALLSVLAGIEQDGALLELDGRLALSEPAGGLRFGGDAEELAALGWPDLPPDAGRTKVAAALARLVATAELRLEDLHRMTTPGRGARPDAVRAVDQLFTQGVLMADQEGRVGFAVPALAAALRKLPVTCDVPELHARIVRTALDRLGPVSAGTGHPRLAGHAIAVGPELDDGVAVPLLLAAAGRYARFSAPRAVAVYGAALDRMRPGPEASGVLRQALELGLRNADYAGSLALAEPLTACLDAAPANAGADLDFSARAWSMAALHEHGPRHTEAAEDRRSAALRRIPAAAGLAALGGRYGIGPLTPMVWAGAPGADEPACGPLPTPAETRLLAAVVGGREDSERARRDLPVAVEGAAWDRLRGVAAYGDLAGALEAVLADRYVKAGDSTAVRYHAVVRDYLAGRWDETLSGVRRIELRSRSRDFSGAAQLARALAGEIHWIRGDIGQARAWLELIPETVFHPLIGRVWLSVRHATGGADEAFERAWQDVEWARENGVLAGLDRLLLRLLSFGSRDGRERDCERAQEELDALHDEVDSPMTRESVLLGRALLHRDAGSVRTALPLVRRRGDRLLALFAWECLVVVGDDPQTWLDEAVRDAQSLGASAYLRDILAVRARQNGLKLSLPRRRATPTRLNESDVRLIDLVSDGETNRRIAALMACSEKTVEQRLTRLFQRTGCRSRTELAASRLDGSLARLGLLPHVPAAGGDARSVAQPGHVHLLG
ncbi:helix-turn-helix transcriptional regulator [Streptomyces lydicus]|uniref:helix-turn-helix transcriptional regulator n=1 Tax=Streptomyces lydicus TaxID=47763 RepID=UPI0013E931AB|nr:LuxR family transcriptional regulator [Streptomyces lydicus]